MQSEVLLQTLYAWKFWHRDITPFFGFPRRLGAELLDSVRMREINMMTGIRRGRKTTLLYHVMQLHDCEHAMLVTESHYGTVSTNRGTIFQLLLWYLLLLRNPLEAIADAIECNQIAAIPASLLATLCPPHR